VTPQIAFADFLSVVGEGTSRIRKVERNTRRRHDAEACRNTVERLFHAQTNDHIAAVLGDFDRFDRVQLGGRRGGKRQQRGRERKQECSCELNGFHYFLPSASCSCRLLSRSVQSPAASCTSSFSTISPSLIEV